MRIIVKSKDKSINIPVSSRALCILISIIPFNTLMRIAQANIPKDAKVQLPDISKRALLKAFWCLHRYKGINLVEVESKNGEKVIVRL